VKFQNSTQAKVLMTLITNRERGDHRGFANEKTKAAPWN
jgi:hypothetical protein